jgi:hypothetical protein
MVDRWMFATPLGGNATTSAKALGSPVTGLANSGSMVEIVMLSALCMLLGKDLCFNVVLFKHYGNLYDAISQQVYHTEVYCSLITLSEIFRTKPVPIALIHTLFPCYDSAVHHYTNVLLIVKASSRENNKDHSKLPCSSGTTTYVGGFV